MKKVLKPEIKSIIRNFLFWILIIFFLEGVFSLTIFESYLRDSILNNLLYSFIIASICSLITNIFPSKINKIITLIILGIFGFIFSLQTVFYRTFKSFFSLSVLGLSDQLESFLSETAHAILTNLPFILLFFLPFIITIIFYKKMHFERNKLSNYITYLVILLLFTGFFLIKINTNKKMNNSLYYLYHDVNEISLNIEHLGLIDATNLDLYRSIFGFNGKIVVVEEEKKEDPESVFAYDDNLLDLNFDKNTSNNDIKTINNYMKNDVGTSQNKYTGLFKDYNLVYITAESFSEIGVSKERTPTLYKLIHDGFEFTNFYTPNNLSTIGGEFQSLTGLFADNSILSTWRKGTNYFPYGLATMFQKNGYNTYAYHNNWYGFQDRHKYLKSQGFTNYLGCYNGLEKRINCKKWPQSDDQMIEKTVDDYINSDKPFLAYYMTVSGHFEYSFSENNMASKHQDKVGDLKKLSTSAKAYAATQIELDNALERLLNSLEKAGKLDKTIIVLLADHYPYELSMKDVNSLSTYERDSVVEVNHNALIIYNSKLKNIKITKTCMSIDVLPTVYNLFGLEYDSRLLIGNDIFSSRDGLAIFKNHSWKTDIGTYYASNGKFEATKEVSSDYVSKMNQVVNNRINVSKLIVKNNYYNYLLK